MKRITLLTLIILIISIPLFGKDSASSSGNYRTFKNIEDAMKQAETKPTILFFYADWCPSCRTADKELVANLDKLGDAVIFVVDYDSSKKLQKKYGVTYQHSFVQITKTGKKLNLWNGGGIDKLVANIRR